MGRGFLGGGSLFDLIQFFHLFFLLPSSSAFLTVLILVEIDLVKFIGQFVGVLLGGEFGRFRLHIFQMAFQSFLGVGVIETLLFGDPIGLVLASRICMLCRLLGMGTLAVLGFAMGRRLFFGMFLSLLGGGRFLSNLS